MNNQCKDYNKRQKQRLHLFFSVLTAVMASLSMVLDRFASFHASSLKIGFAFVPIVLVAILCGPAYAAAAGAVADLVGALCFPFGPYHPGFTVTAALMGLVYGLFLHRDRLRWWQVAIPTAVNNLVFGLLINTVWIMQLYGKKTYWAYLTGRLLTEYTVLIPLNLIFIPILFRLSITLRNRMNF